MQSVDFTNLPDKKMVAPPKVKLPDVPFEGRHPNVYGGLKTAEHLLPYLQYVDPEERERFKKLSQNAQVRELLWEDVNTLLFLGFPAASKYIGGVVKGGAQSILPAIEQFLPKTFSTLTKAASSKMGQPIVKGAQAVGEFATRTLPNPLSKALEVVRGEKGSVSIPQRPGFVSKLEEVVNSNKMPMKMNKGDLFRMLENNGVSQAEIQNTLLPNLIAGEKSVVTKGDVLDAIKVGKTKFKDVVLGNNKYKLTLEEEKEWTRLNNIQREFTPDEIARYDYLNNEFMNIPGNSTHYEQYSEPGYVPGSYREMFVTAPEAGIKTGTGIKKFGVADAPTEFYDIKDNWNDGHSAYSNIQNPIVRIRYNDREVNRKKILFVEEFQGPSPSEQAKMPSWLQKRIYDIGVKRVLFLAKEKGYDGVAWTSGEMQASRYDLSKHIDLISYDYNTETGIGLLKAFQPNAREPIIEDVYSPKDLENVIGKEATQKIVKQLDPSKPFNITRLEEADLKVGGEGLKKLYDQQIPSLFKKYGKEGVGEINLSKPTISKTGSTPARVEDWLKELTDGEIDEKGFETRMKSIGYEWGKDGYYLVYGGTVHIPRVGKVPYTPITSKTPSHYPMYTLPPLLLGLGATQQHPPIPKRKEQR